LCYNASYLLDESLGRTACIEKHVSAINAFKKSYSTFHALNHERIFVDEGVDSRAVCTSAFNEYIYDAETFSNALNDERHHPISGPFSIGDLKENEDICIEIKRIEPFCDVVWCLTRSAGVLNWKYNNLTNSSYSRKMRISENTESHQCNVGFIGTVSDEKMSSGRGGSHGGNLDLPCVKAGSKIILPALRKSSNVWFGDIHYKQGWGELSGVALECSGLISFAQKRITLIEKTKEPIVIESAANNTFLYFVGIRESYEKALQSAIDNMMRYKRAFNCFDDSAMYYKIGTEADLMIGQAIGKTISIAIKLKIDRLENMFQA